MTVECSHVFTVGGALLVYFTTKPTGGTTIRTCAWLGVRGFWIQHLHYTKL